MGTNERDQGSKVKKSEFTVFFSFSSLNSKYHCNAHFALLLPQFLFLDSCHVFVVCFAGSKLENQAGLYQARIHQALSRIGTIWASALKISHANF